MGYVHRKRGRPRLSRPKVDKGTSELQKKKKLLVEKGQDLSLSESLLGILFSKNIISQEHYDTGQTFREIGYRYESCLGHVFRYHSNILTPKRGGEISEPQDEFRTKRWRDALNALKKSGERHYLVVMKVVFYDRDLYEEKASLTGNDINDLRCGLDYLDQYFKGGLRGDIGKKIGNITCQRRVER
jgi:hypothetical protein